MNTWLLPPDKAEKIGVDLQPVDVASLNFSYVYLLAKNDDTALYHLIEKPEHTFKYTLNMKWRAFGLIHYLRKLKESKGDVVNSVQGSSGLRNGAKRKKHWNRFRAKLILPCMPGKKRSGSTLPERKRT